MKHIHEVEYKKIFKPETIELLKGKSAESLRQLLGNKNLMQTMVESSRLLPKIIEAEKDYRDELEMVAVQMVKDAYPIVEYAGIEIDAKIDMELNIGNVDMKPSKEEWEELPQDKRRRIINGITQGSSIRGAFGFMLFREYIDQLDDTLVQKYNDILKLSFGIYDNEEAIALMLQMLNQNRKIEGGKVYIKINVPENDEEESEEGEEEPKLTIVARAVCFPMLVHEIVKGLYEILSLQGFSGNKKQNQDIVDKIDKIQNEPDDLRYGKFIYDAISNLYNNSQYDDARIRELLFVELYKLPDDEFFPFIENTINGKLLPSQKKWVEETMRDINNDLKADDADDVLYERMQKLANIKKKDK